MQSLRQNLENGLDVSDVLTLVVHLRGYFSGFRSGDIQSRSLSALFLHVRLVKNVTRIRSRN